MGGLYVLYHAIAVLPVVKHTGSESTRLWSLYVKGVFFLFGVFFLVIGIGSALFHGTLKRGAQIMDEVPMIYSSLTYCYLLSLISDTS